MLSKTELKFLLRSKSLKFTLDSRAASHSEVLHSYTWHGKEIYYRPGTSDVLVIYQILLKSGKKSEYHLPIDLNPKTILDIGGNIGISSIYFANLFPQAKIFTFEPAPDNFNILSKNIAPYPNIQAFPVALGKENGTFDLYYSDQPTNYGGFSFFPAGTDVRQKIEVKVKNVATILNELDINQVDLLKIDTEGAEFDIITAIPEAKLRSVKWIVGELHGNRDFELLEYLSQWFDIGAKKSMGKRLFMFSAFNNAIR